jgi:CHASE2 domain-containing sensor protein
MATADGMAIALCRCMALQMLLTQLLLLLSAGLFYRGQWLPALTVLAVYIVTLITVVASAGSIYQQSDDCSRLQM